MTPFSGARVARRGRTVLVLLPIVRGRRCSPLVRRAVRRLLLAALLMRLSHLRLLLARLVLFEVLFTCKHSTSAVRMMLHCEHAVFLARCLQSFSPVSQRAVRRRLAGMRKLPHACAARGTCASK